MQDVLTFPMNDEGVARCAGHWRSASAPLLHLGARLPDCVRTQCTRIPAPQPLCSLLHLGSKISECVRTKTPHQNSTFLVFLWSWMCMHFFDRRWGSARCVRTSEVIRSTFFFDVYVPKASLSQPSGSLVK